MLIARWVLASFLGLIASLAAAGHWETTFTQVGEWESWGPSNANYYSGDYAVSGNTTSKTIFTGGAIWTGFFWLPVGGAGGAQCDGEIIATLTWAPSNGNNVLDPPPPVAFVKETAIASYRGTSGDCDPDISSNLTTNSSGPDEDGFYSVSKSAIKYHVKNGPGASFNVTCTPSASVTAAGMPGGQATVSYKVEAWAVNIAVGGTTADPGDENIRKILPGQKVTGVVVYGDGAPLTPALDETSDPPVHDTTWTISDCSPFLDYVVASGSATGTLTTYAPQKGATGWAFWAKPGTGTVACEHKMKLTEGPETVIPVSLEKTVPVVTPTVEDTFVSPQSPGGFCNTYGEHGYVVGFNKMGFTGKITTPGMFVVNSNHGSWDFVQLIRGLDRGYVQNGQTFPWTSNFSWDSSDDQPPRKLDSGYPYQGGQVSDGTPGITIDIPQRGVDVIQLEKIWINDRFTMYWMYTPPVVDGYASRPVPVAKRDWDVALKGESPYWLPWGTLVTGSPTIFHLLGTLEAWPAHPSWVGVVGDL
jgi:hypothetical protein